MITVKILLFATLKDVAGTNKLDLPLAQDTAVLADVRRALVAKFPPLEERLGAAIAAINEEYAFNEDSVSDGDVVAFFPPVSGGSGDVLPTILSLQAEPIDHDALVQSVTLPVTGAVVVFSGMVRGETNKDGVETIRTNHLEYEAYESMAKAKMQQVADEIRQQWPLVQGIAIIQRVGKLTVGQNTILIACSSGHRNDGCFEASKYGIDRLKEIVPVWKKEVSEDGTFWVKGGYMPTPQDKHEN